eukprot:363455-Chlamydomonas_euryale.AAC.5
MCQHHYGPLQLDPCNWHLEADGIFTPPSSRHLHSDSPRTHARMQAVDKNTLVQLHGQAAKGYAFDRRYGQAASSDEIYDDVINDLVNQVFRGYNGTVMAYGQTGSGKTHTMSGGVGIHGRSEEGIIPRVIRQVYDMTEAIAKVWPGSFSNAGVAMKEGYR